MNNIIDGMSMDIEQINMNKLKSVFPECFAEGKLDIDKLLSLCGEYIDNDFEKYKFEWKGKSECLRLAQKRSTGTLRPCVEESVNWDTTKNLYIEGDNLEVLKLLQTSYYRKVKMIYIDPPYNTGNDFVYNDSFADPIARYKEVTQQTTKSNPETMGKYHTNWLNMMYPRLRLASNLLRDDGVIFISIDDNEVDNLKKLCNEVFGEENFVAHFTRKGSGGRQDSKHFAIVQEYILCYSKNINMFNSGKIIKDDENYPYFDEEKKLHYKVQLLRKWGENSKRADRPNLYYPIKDPDGNDFYPMLSDTEEGCWRWGKQTMFTNIEDGLVEFKLKNGKWIAYEKIFEPTNGEVKTKLYTTIIDDISNNTGASLLKDLFNNKIFDYPKPVDLIKRVINLGGLENNDIILDFFSGSATTAHAVMQLNKEDGRNRQFIMVQLPEVCDEKSEAYKAGYKNICEIGKERIRRAGVKLIETDEQIKIDDNKNTLDVGFKVFKLDTSNLKTWDNTPIEDEQINLLYDRMNSMINRVKNDRSDLDMVCEIMLKIGVPLTYSITPIEINNKTAYAIGDDCLLLICLAPNVQPEDIEQMVEYAPAKLIVSRESFIDDTAMANAHYILRDNGIELKLV